MIIMEEEKVKRKVLASLLVIAVVVGLVSAGTWAYFSDTETSSGNTFQAGTIDLVLDETQAVSMQMPNMKPGDSASGTITVTNVGTLPGSLYITSKYVENDMGGAPDPNMNRHQVAKMLLITSLVECGDDVLSLIPDVDADDRKTLYDFVNKADGVVLSDYPSPGELGTWYLNDDNMDPNGNEPHWYALTLQFDPAAGNDYQGDGITWTLWFLLTQQ